MGLKPDEAAIEAAMPKARAVFAELARLLGDQPFFAGDAVSLADLMVAPQLGFFTATPEWADLGEPHKNLVAWLARMEARPSMKATTGSGCRRWRRRRQRRHQNPAGSALILVQFGRGHQLPRLRDEPIGVFLGLAKEVLDVAAKAVEIELSPPPEGLAVVAA